MHQNARLALPERLRCVGLVLLLDGFYDRVNCHVYVCSVLVTSCQLHIWFLNRCQCRGNKNYRWLDGNQRCDGRQPTLPSAGTTVFAAGKGVLNAPGTATTAPITAQSTARACSRLVLAR